MNQGPVNVHLDLEPGEVTLIQNAAGFKFEMQEEDIAEYLTNVIAQHIDGLKPSTPLEMVYPPYGIIPEDSTENPSVIGYFGNTLETVPEKR